MSPIVLLSGILLSVLALTSCKSIPENTPHPTKQIAVQEGPEDMAMDNFSKPQRILVSCFDRRDEENTSEGSIVAFYPKGDSVVEMERVNEPEGLEFRPHGIAVQQVEGKPYLYVISHSEDPLKHYIHQYECLPRSLSYIQSLTSPLLRSPNDLYVAEDGSMYVSNDRFDSSTMKEVILGKKKGSIVHKGPGEDDEWEIFADNLGFPNGLFVKDSLLYVALTRENRIVRIPLKGGEAETVHKIVGPDNITEYRGVMYTVAHTKPIAFIRHAKKASKPSPIAVWMIVPGLERARLRFADDGKRISAGSTAILLGNRMFISQVFQPYLLEVDITE